MRWHMLKLFIMEGKDLVILYSQYHGCRWPGNTRSQGINSNGIDIVLLENILAWTPEPLNKDQN